MKVASNTAAAQSAVSGFAGIDVAGAGQQVSLGVSNMSGMQAGAELTNKLLQDVSRLVSGVKSEADRVAGLAARIEARDTQDAKGLKVT